MCTENRQTLVLADNLLKSGGGVICFLVNHGKSELLQLFCKMTSAGNQKEKSLFVPRPARSHALTFDQDNQICFRVGGSQNPITPVQVIKGDIENAFH